MAKGQEIQLLPDEAKRAEVFNEMTKPLQKVANGFMKKLEAAAKGVVLLYYDMGVELTTVIGDDAIYGTNAVGQIARYIGKSDGELYEFLNVVKAYDRAEIEAFTLRQMAAGGYISWSHLVAVTTIKKATDRKKMWERIFTESLSVRQVANEALSTMDRNNSSRGLGGGRPPARATSPLAGTTQIYQQFHGINTRAEGWTEDVFDALDNVAPDKVDPQYVEKIKIALDEIVKAKDRISEFEDRLQGNLERAEAIVEKQKEEEEAAATEAAAAAEAAASETPVEGEAPAAEGGGKKKTTKKKKSAGRRRPAAATA